MTAHPHDYSPYPMPHIRMTCCAVKPSFPCQFKNLKVILKIIKSCCIAILYFTASQSPNGCECELILINILFLLIYMYLNVFTVFQYLYIMATNLHFL